MRNIARALRAFYYYDNDYESMTGIVRCTETESVIVETDGGP